MDYPNEVSRVYPLGRELGHPYIKSGGQVTYRERGYPDRVVVSLREGKLVKLVCKKGHFVLRQRTFGYGCHYGLEPTSRHGMT
jgi:hypothetical protein